MSTYPGTERIHAVFEPEGYADTNYDDVNRACTIWLAEHPDPSFDNPHNRYFITPEAAEFFSQTKRKDRKK